MTTPVRKAAFLTEDDWELLVTVCRDAGVPPDIVERMLAEESKVYGMGRRHRVKEALEDLVAEGVQRSIDKRREGDPR